MSCNDKHHYKFSYFDVRSLGEACRLLFAYGGQEYEDVRVQWADWAELKPKTPLGKLPVLEVDHGKFVLSQSSAIARYLAEKYGLAGKGEEEKARVNELLDWHKDQHREMVTYAALKAGFPFPMDVKVAYEEHFLPTMKTYLPVLQKLIKASKSGFLVASGLTFVDFFVADVLQTLSQFEPETFAEYSELSAYISRVYATTRPLQAFFYFDARALGETIRLLFAHVGQEFEDKRVQWGKWPELKPKTPFDKIPLLEVDHGKFVVSQSAAIYGREICRDNQWLVFQSPFLDWDYDYYNQIFAVNLNDAPSTVRGHRQIRCISNGIGEYLHPDFYPDSKSLIFTSNFHNKSIWVQELKAKFKHDYKQNLYTDSPPLPPTIQTDYCSHSPYRVQCYAMYNAAWKLSNGRSYMSYSWTEMSRKRKEMKTDAVWIRPLSPDMDIFRMDLEGNIQMQLTNETGFDGYGTISPDGRWIVYTSMSTGDPELWIMNAVNGSGKRQLLRRKGFEGSVSFSSDGKRIIFIGTPSPITHAQRQVYDKRLSEKFGDSIGAAADLPAVALNSAQTQIAFFSDLREHEKSTHRLRTLFIANWINNERNMNSVKQMSSKQRYKISFSSFYDNGPQFAKETFFNHVQQLTFGGTNLAPKFSSDEKLIFFESVDTNNLFYKKIKSMVLSHNSGKFTVSEPYPFGAGFGSTHSLAVVPVQIRDPYYIYAYEHNFCAQQKYQICSQNKMVHDSDVAISPNGRWIVFSSMESGDPELWIFELATLGEYYSSWTSDDDGLWKIKGVNRITHRLGYEFGASFSRDSQKIVFAASVPTEVGEIESYKKLLRY
ncbi:WD40-like beta propeller repeat domain-containing protein [Ditylenchus destructor]|nr:WD40-like beta propeller repeat domain-containing protein [Ditylenchus destructor]